MGSELWAVAGIRVRGFPLRVHLFVPSAVDSSFGGSPHLMVLLESCSDFVALLSKGAIVWREGTACLTRCGRPRHERQQGVAAAPAKSKHIR